MKFETVLPYAKIGIAVLAGVMGGTGATMAYKQTAKADTKPCPAVTVTCKCDHPPIKGELIFKK